MSRFTIDPNKSVAENLKGEIRLLGARIEDLKRELFQAGETVDFRPHVISNMGSFTAYFKDVPSYHVDMGSYEVIVAEDNTIVGFEVADGATFKDDRKQVLEELKVLQESNDLLEETVAELRAELARENVTSEVGD